MERVSSASYGSQLAEFRNVMQKGQPMHARFTSSTASASLFFPLPLRTQCESA